MPITKGAKKALRASKRKRVYNLVRKDAVKDVIKELRRLSTSGKKDEAVKLLPKVYEALDKAAKTKVIKKNTADRKKSRFAQMLKK